MDNEAQEVNNETENVEGTEIESENDESADEEAEEEECETDNQETEKPRLSRIVRAFEDSDDEETTTVDLQKTVIAEPNFDPMEDLSQNQLENNSFNETAQNTQNLTDKSISEEMKEFESRIFDTDSQKPTSTATTIAETSKTGNVLFDEDAGNDDIDESQLMALCSGAFVTQQPEIVRQNPIASHFFY